MSKKYVGTHSFAKSRHTKESQYSYFTGTWDNLERLVENHLHDKTPAAVPGAFIVSLPPITPYGHFYSGVVEVTPETQLNAKFIRRRDDEQYYIEVTAIGASKTEAKSVDIVIYTHEALAIDNDAETNLPYEIISINARPTEGEEPQSPTSMARNQLGLPGGSKAEYTAEEFARSIIYWSRHVMSDSIK